MSAERYTASCGRAADRLEEYNDRLEVALEWELTGRGLEEYALKVDQRQRDAYINAENICLSVMKEDDYPLELARVERQLDRADKLYARLDVNDIEF